VLCFPLIRRSPDPFKTPPLCSVRVAPSFNSSLDPPCVVFPVVMLLGPHSPALLPFSFFFGTLCHNVRPSYCLFSISTIFSVDFFYSRSEGVIRELRHIGMGCVVSGGSSCFLNSSGSQALSLHFSSRNLSFPSQAGLGSPSTPS